MSLRPARPVTPIGILAQRLAHLDGESSDELAACVRLAAGLEPYVAACTTPESPALAALARATRERDWDGRDGARVAVEQEMLSGHVEGVALRFLIRMSRATRVLEIGMFTGYGSLAMAEALPAGGRLVACELDPDVAAFARAQLGATAAGAIVDVRVGPAGDTLAALAQAQESFDFVFLDADKAGYLDYVTTVLERGLLARGGTICVDNTLLQGEPWLADERSPNGTAIAAFNAAIADDPRIEQVLVPLRDGMTLIRRAGER